ncbi:uncharacterized protein [Procambarus clarkii]|uniref:uncharacterized protein n=1 Tax=Procambarus clarkii TaxID=6728 RepID=UPI001E67106D|nr:uncharacterized histidine-rich protein DDB_G0274557-like [Procambarus clarkii]
MKRNSTFRYPSPAQALYLPDEVNFWTMAIVAVGTGFILTVAVSIYLICQTRLERPLPVRHHRTVRHISHGPDVYPQSGNHYHLHHHHHPSQHPHLDDVSTPYPASPHPRLNEMTSSIHYLDPNTSPLHDLED